MNACDATGLSLVVLREDDADQGVDDGHQRDGHRGRLHHGLPAVSADVFLGGREGSSLRIA